MCLISFTSVVALNSNSHYTGTNYRYNVTVHTYTYTPRGSISVVPVVLVPFQTGNSCSDDGYSSREERRQTASRASTPGRRCREALHGVASDKHF